MSFEWTDDLRTGVDDIDLQHREIIDRVNGLMRACTGHGDREAVGSYLAFLMEYVAYHFAAEEREMAGRRYPRLAEHEAQHDLFKAKVNALSRSFREQGATLQVVLMTVRSAGEWLVNHIKRTDRELAAFLKQKSA